MHCRRAAHSACTKPPSLAWSKRQYTFVHLAGTGAKEPVGTMLPAYPGPIRPPVVKQVLMHLACSQHVPNHQALYGRDGKSLRTSRNQLGRRVASPAYPRLTRPPVRRRLPHGAQASSLAAHVSQSPLRHPLSPLPRRPLPRETDAPEVPLWRGPRVPPRRCEGAVPLRPFDQRLCPVAVL